MNRKLIFAYARLIFVLAWFPSAMFFMGYITADQFTKGFFYGGGWIGTIDQIYNSVRFLRENDE